MEQFTDDQITKLKQSIDGMSQMGMASLWRYAPPGHPFFRHDLPLFDYFQARFKSFGGMTPQVSKAIE